ncbi:isotrichodermin C-15 hydroxylase [Coniochaeta ligniaria NRRL 30616]|uniref:Isotrichodermin C-15 hydroxylase n=1 Tax=Coniochaeta ligniaria NRRL 30616 TaxID=1408157 RepID=A0A1J7IEF1_9PEZI|nr:isotrichodermin C-15 hydroxylase [Coniochaeta ligniaria NRRL 30616]
MASSKLLEIFLHNLTLTNVALAAVAFCVLLPAYYFVYNVYFHPLAGIPGPKLYAAFDMMKVKEQMKGTIVWTITELHEKYGPVVRIAPNEVTFISAKAWSDIYGNRGGYPLPTAEAYGVHEKDFFGALSLLWVGDATQHARHRKVLSPAFSDKSLRDQEPLIRQYVDLLVQRLTERKDEPVDLWAWLNYTTFDLIGDLTFGEPFGCLQEAKFHPWIAFVFSRLKMMMYGQIMITLGAIGTFITFFVPQRVKNEALDHIAFTKAKVNSRLERQTQRPDFMSQILGQTAIGSKQKLDGTGISEPELYADSNILIMAGSETSATLMAALFYHLLVTPRALSRLTQEIRATFKRESDIDFQSVSQSSYLLAVINEGLRSHPPLPVGISRVTRPEGAMIDGHFVTGNVAVHVPHWACYHNSKNFRDAYEFVPERWLEDDLAAAERYKDDNKAAFQPFSIGNRNCLGRSLAIMETRLILTRLLWNFDIELMTESSNWAHQKVFMLYEKKPMWVRVTPVKREGVGA